MIRFSYEPPVSVAITSVQAAATFYSSSNGRDFTQETYEVSLTRNKRKFHGTLQSRKGNTLIALRLKYNGVVDKNSANQFFIVLYDTERIPAAGANHQIALSYLYGQDYGGVSADADSALAFFKKEVLFFPSARRQHLSTYLRILKYLEQGEREELLSAEIHLMLKNGLRTEDDYHALALLYKAGEAARKADSISSVRKERFKDGKWRADEAVQQLYAEPDPLKAVVKLEVIKRGITAKSQWKHLQPSVSNYEFAVGEKYYRIKDWRGYRDYIIGLGDPTMKPNLYGYAIYNMTDDEMAFNFQIFVDGKKDSTTAQHALRFLESAVEFAGKEWKDPQLKKPGWQTDAEWEESRKNRYCLFSHRYAKALHLMGKHREAFAHVNTVMNINPIAEYTELYSLVAEQVLPIGDYQPRLEDFIRNGLTSSATIEVLKRAYVAQSGTQDGFDAYLSALESERSGQAVQALRESMLNEPAPPFTLTDSAGTVVTLESFRGKVVILDFWATWCAPCIQSFPAMEKVINKYKDQGDVQFLFINSLENSKDRKQHLKRFLTRRPYPFTFLVDGQDIAYHAYHVPSIPAKFVIDKTGVIRFKTFDYDGNELKLITELSTMIDLTRALAPTDR